MAVVSRGVLVLHRSLVNHGHDLDTRQDNVCVPEIVGAYQRFDDAFNGTMVVPRQGYSGARSWDLMGTSRPGLIACGAGKPHPVPLSRLPFPVFPWRDVISLHIQNNLLTFRACVELMPSIHRLPSGP